MLRIKQACFLVRNAVCIFSRQLSFMTPDILKMASKSTARTLSMCVMPWPSPWAQGVMSCVHYTSCIDSLRAAGKTDTELAMKTYSNRAACFKQISNFDGTIEGKIKPESLGLPLRISPFHCVQSFSLDWLQKLWFQINPDYRLHSCSWSRPRKCESTYPQSPSIRRSRALPFFTTRLSICSCPALWKSWKDKLWFMQHDAASFE